MTNRKKRRYLIHDSTLSKFDLLCLMKHNDFDYKQAITFLMIWFLRSLSAALPS
jgi:hypothetical protein